MERIQFLQDFNVPKEKVFDFFSDYERWGEIYPGAFKRTVDSHDSTYINGVGSVRKIFIFPITFEETIIKFEPNNLIEYMVTKGGQPIKDHKATIRFYDLDNGTRSRLDYNVELDSVVPFAALIVKNIIVNVMGRGIRNLSKKFDEGKIN